MAEAMTIKDAVKAAKKDGIDIAGVTTPSKKLPKNKLGPLVDDIRVLRDQRLAVSKVAEALKAEELRLTEHIIETVEANDEGGAVGKKFKGVVVRDVKPVIEDYDALTAHIQKTGEFDLLNRAVNASAAKDRWENDVDVPGIGKFNFKKLSITKL